MKIKNQGKLHLKNVWTYWPQRLVLTLRNGVKRWTYISVRGKLLVGLCSFLLLIGFGWGIGRQMGFSRQPTPLVVNEAIARQEGEAEEDLGAMVRKLQNDLSELRQKLNEKTASSSTQTPMEATVTFSPLMFNPPVAGRVVSQGGWEKKSGEWRYHSGIDFAVPVGTEVRSAAAGMVQTVKTDPALGTVITIDHGNDWRSLYGHLHRVQVSVGQKVTGTTLLGYSSSTSCGPEPGIHFNLYHQENPVDPLTVLNFSPQ